MSFPLVPLFANIFMDFYEYKWLNYNLNKPKVYLRYIDDIVAGFESHKIHYFFLYF